MEKTKLEGIAVVAPGVPKLLGADIHSAEVPSHINEFVEDVVVTTILLHLLPPEQLI